MNRNKVPKSSPDSRSKSSTKKGPGRRHFEPTPGSVLAPLQQKAEKRALTKCWP